MSQSFSESLRAGPVEVTRIRRHQMCYFRKYATSAPAEFEDKFTKSREIEHMPRSFCRRGGCTFREVARLVSSGSLHDRNLYTTTNVYSV